MKHIGFYGERVCDLEKLKERNFRPTSAYFSDASIGTSTWVRLEIRKKSIDSCT